MALGRTVVLTLIGMLVPSWAGAVDLRRIERMIDKEPAYATEAPRYFMIALGPEARTRVWVVVDGDVAYVDRDGDGDLTEAGERVEGENGAFTIGELTDPQTGRTHTELVVRIDRRIEVSDGSSYTQPFGMNGRVRGKYQFIALTKPAEQAGKAPIIHLDAPLRARAFGGDFRTVWRDREEKFSIQFYSRGLDAAIYIYYEGVPERIFPVADFVYPAGSADGEPIKRKVVLRERC